MGTPREDKKEVSLDEAAEKLLSRREVFRGIGKRALGLGLMVGLGVMMPKPYVMDGLAIGLLNRGLAAEGFRYV